VIEFADRYNGWLTTLDVHGLLHQGLGQLREQSVFANKVSGFLAVSQKAVDQICVRIFLSAHIGSSILRIFGRPVTQHFRMLG